MNKVLILRKYPQLTHVMYFFQGGEGSFIFIVKIFLAEIINTLDRVKCLKDEFCRIDHVPLMVENKFLSKSQI